MRHARWFKRLPVPAAAICVLLAAGCLGKPEMTVPEAYDYESRPILINNADWGVIPLPNNFLNPVKQAEIVYIPGVPLPNAMPTGMALPVVDETAAAVAQALGDLQLTILVGVSLPYALNSIYWFLFYKTYPKDVKLQDQRSAAIAAGTF